jgi:hypothetical protein
MDRVHVVERCKLLMSLLGESLQLRGGIEQYNISDLTKFTAEFGRELIVEFKLDPYHPASALDSIHSCLVGYVYENKLIVSEGEWGSVRYNRVDMGFYFQIIPYEHRVAARQRSFVGRPSQRENNGQESPSSTAQAD